MWFLRTFASSLTSKGKRNDKTGDSFRSVANEERYIKEDKEKIQAISTPQTSERK